MTVYSISRLFFFLSFFSSAAIAGVGSDDVPIVLGALLGASIFISTVVLGSVIFVSRPFTVDRVSFLRDILIYIIATVTIIAVAYDGHIHIHESIMYVFASSLSFSFGSCSILRAMYGT